MPELPLDDDQRDALVGHLDRVRVAELVRRKAPTHARPDCCTSQLLAGRGLLPMPASGRAVNDAQQRADGEPRADLHPWM